MKNTLLVLLKSFLLLTSSFACGNNTSVPALASPLAYPPAKTPEIIRVDFISTPENHLQYDLSYYVSNEEADFIGYNLYVNLTPSSLKSYLITSQDDIYLPRGIEPSFSHSGDTASAAPGDLKTQRITHRTAPPVPEPFYECQVYYFRLVAYLRGGFLSEASNEVQVCAFENPASCPSGSPCNP